MSGWGGGRCAEAHPKARWVVRVTWEPWRVLVGLIAIFPSTFAFAQDCSNPQTRMVTEQCAALHYEQSDAELNAIYNQIRSRLKSDAEAAAMLLNAQRNWLTFRDAECEFQSHKGFRGLRRLALNNCLDQLTQQRSAQLELYLNCQEGDIGCPVPSGN